MTLYTEEQLKKNLHPDLFNLILPQLKPIVLPTNEFIEKAACGNIDQYHGAMWLKKEIIIQTK